MPTEFFLDRIIGNIGKATPDFGVVLLLRPPVCPHKNVAYMPALPVELLCIFHLNCLVETGKNLFGRQFQEAKGREGVSTAEAYGSIDRLASPQHPDTHKLTEAISSAPDTAYSYFGNLFEQAVKLAEVDGIIADMLKYGGRRAVMTGSGSAVFGLFTDPEQAVGCADKLREKGYFSTVCETVAESFITID